MNVPRTRPCQVLAVLATLATGFAGLPAAAQSIKPGREFYTNALHGFRFKPPTDYPGVPLQPGDEETGLVGKMGGPTVIIKLADRVSQAKSEIRVFAFGDPEQEAVSEERTAAAAKRTDVAERLTRSIRGFDSAVAEEPAEDEAVKVGKLQARHRVWKANTGEFVVVLDAWTFPLELEDVSIVYIVPEDKADDYLRVFERSAKTFEIIERKEGTALSSGASYAERLAKAHEDAARVEGWRALPTPSQKYIIKTSSENKKFLDEVVKRLEKSRELYERDFPPKEDFDHVSVVRVCGTEQEFHQYGGTSGGVAGWFNPGTTELVLYDAVNIDRNMTYAVMSHEAFHQYCHFLFDQSEAHRWFDEGHGDYYGGIEFKGSRAIVTARMPSGLDRLSVIREMVRSKPAQWKPLKQHLNYDHGQWQTQGPTNVSCYAQSWSIVYMLRQGALGKVSRRIWQEEYADIIPSYVETLHAGFQEAFEEIRKPIRERAEKEGREPTPEELAVTSHMLPPKQKKEIWEKAIAASWGTIDLDEFEERWVRYIETELK